MLTVGSVFAGQGGFDLGFERAGAKVIWSCEIDANCRKVLRKHWPGVPRFKDVRTVTGAGLRKAGLVPDVLVGGFPCQDLSVAGARAGLDGERSGLFFEFARIAEEARPEWLVIENVPGLLSAGCRPPCVGGCIATHGGAMGAVIGTLADIGFVGAWRVLDAQYAGVAQRRRRVFLVCHARDGRRAAEVLLEPEGGGGDPPARRAPGAGPAGGAEGGAGGDGGEPYTFDWQAGGHGDTSFRGKSRIYPVRKPGVNGSLQVNKVEAVAIPDVSNALCSNRGQRNDHNEQTFVPVAFSQNGSDVQATGDRTACLRGEGSSSGNGGINIAYSVYPESGQGADLRATEVEIAPTLGAETLAKQAERGTHIVSQSALSFQERTRAGGANLEHQEDLAYALLNPGEGGRASDRNIVTPQLAVRRLLPVECLRLQAFPDWWLDDLGLADSTKYRQIGNAVCVNVVEWIAHRLIASHSR